MDKKQKAKAVKIEKIYPNPEKLKPFGSKLRGSCPFHSDNSNPNFFIYTQTNTYFCFAGCGGGDAINFIMKLENLDFKDALKRLGRLS